MVELDVETRDLTAELIRRESVSPEDAGCQQVMCEVLAELGFTIRDMPFEDVSNFWAVRDGGSPGPTFVFAGHTDVVPPGPVEDWHTDPFEPVIDGDMIYGRGAADMKGSLAAMLSATRRFLAANPTYNGRIAYLITSDEEADAINGTVKVIDTLIAEGEQIDYCLVGEPSSSAKLGDVIRVGRRGSLSATLTVNGIQGHVAYPDQARNPIHEALAALSRLAEESWDNGNEYFPPTSMQMSNIHAGTGANNVIPGRMEVKFNFRFASVSSAESLRERTEAILGDLDYDIEWSLSGAPFLTTERDLIDAVTASLSEAHDVDTELSTSGGTSDGRFIAPHGIQVVELGPCNATIHKINECASLTELSLLSRVHTRILERLLVSAS